MIEWKNNVQKKMQMSNKQTFYDNRCRSSATGQNKPYI